MASNSVLINDVIRFSIDDVGMERLILLLRASGSLELVLSLVWVDCSTSE